MGLAALEAQKGQQGGSALRKRPVAAGWGGVGEQQAQDSSVKPQDDGERDNNSISVLTIENIHISLAPLGETDLAL